MEESEASKITNNDGDIVSEFMTNNIINYNVSEIEIVTDKSINNNITEIKTEEFHSEDSNEIVMEEAEPKSDLPIISGELYYAMPVIRNGALVGIYCL